MAARIPIYSNASFEMESEDNQPVYTSSIKRGHHKTADREVYTLVSPSTRSPYSFVHSSGDVIYRDTSFGGTGGEIAHKSDGTYYYRSGDGIPYYKTEVMHYGVPHYYRADGTHYRTRSEGALYRSDAPHYKSDGALYRSDGAHYKSDGTHYKSDGTHYKSDGTHYKSDGGYYFSRSILPGRYYTADEPGELERLKKTYPSSLRIVHPESSKHHASHSAQSYHASHSGQSYHSQRRAGAGSSSYAITTSQPAYTHSLYSVAAGEAGRQYRLRDYTFHSLFIMLFCCLPMGVYAFLLSGQSRKLWDKGSILEAQTKSRAALRWIAVGFILGLMFITLIVVIPVVRLEG